jgi:signal transduction histidine kinase
MTHRHHIDAYRSQMNLSQHRTTLTTPLNSRSERISTKWLSASIVHDLRNPFGTVIAGSEMLLELDPPAQVKRLAANVLRAAGRMRDLVADLAGASCGSKSTPEICKIRDVIAAASDVASPVAEKQSVRILNNVTSGIEIPMARSRMERVFFNLIANALEAMPHDGEIRIGARKVDNCVWIEVEDTGPGIPLEIRDWLFEPFVTAGNDRGLGLGLALSRQTVRDHGGDMWTEPAGRRSIL